MCCIITVAVVQPNNTLVTELKMGKIGIQPLYDCSTLNVPLWTVLVSQRNHKKHAVFMRCLSVPYHETAYRLSLSRIAFHLAKLGALISVDGSFWAKTA